MLTAHRPLAGSTTDRAGALCLQRPFLFCLFGNSVFPRASPLTAVVVVACPVGSLGVEPMCSANPIHVTSPYLPRRRSRAHPFPRVSDPDRRCRTTVRLGVTGSSSRHRLGVPAARCLPQRSGWSFVPARRPHGSCCLCRHLIFFFYQVRVRCWLHPPAPPPPSRLLVLLFVSPRLRWEGGVFARDLSIPLLPLVASHGPARARVFWGCEDHS